MVATEPSTLHFADRRVDGRLVVSTMSGAPVALIARSRFVRRFSATLPHGPPLCRGRARFGTTRAMAMFDAEDRRCGHLAQRGRGYDVSIGNRALQLRVRWFGRGWVLTDEAGAEVLWSVRRAVAGWPRENLETGRRPADVPTVLIMGHRFHGENLLRNGPDDWLVTPSSSLDLAYTVAIVESYRLCLRAARNAAAGPP